MFKCFEGENTSMCEAIRQMVDEGISMGQKQGSLNEKNDYCSSFARTENA